MTGELGAGYARAQLPSQPCAAANPREEKFRIPSAGNESCVSPMPGEPTEGTDARPGLTAPSGFYVVLVQCCGATAVWNEPGRGIWQNKTKNLLIIYYRFLK